MTSYKGRYVMKDISPTRGASQVSQTFSKKQWAIALAIMTLAFLLGAMLVVIPRNFSAHAAGASITLVPKKANYKKQSGIVVKWSFNSNSSFPNFSAPLVDPVNNLVFFGTIGYQSTGIPSPLYALDAQTGALKWSMIMAWNVYGPPTVALKTLYVGVARGANPTQIYAIDEITGKLDWQNPINGSIWGAIAVDTSTNTAIAFITNPASMVVAFDATLGIVKWQSPIAGSSSSSQAGS
ncbi:MAG TPA: hypothetical protein DCK85_10195, partial [Ktedonobacter sp.]|nr:hypothetical protein [Ktedonobacter sp.]